MLFSSKQRKTGSNAVRPSLTQSSKVCKSIRAKRHDFVHLQHRPSRLPKAIKTLIPQRKQNDQAGWYLYTNRKDEKVQAKQKTMQECHPDPKKDEGRHPCHTDLLGNGIQREKVRSQNGESMPVTPSPCKFKGIQEMSSLGCRQRDQPSVLPPTLTPRAGWSGRIVEARDAGLKLRFLDRVSAKRSSFRAANQAGPKSFFNASTFCR